MLDVPDYRHKPLIRFIYAWPAFIGILLLTVLTFYGVARCLLRGFGATAPLRIGTNTTSPLRLRQDVFYVVAAPLVFQGLCVSIYTTWLSWKFFRHN